MRTIRRRGAIPTGGWEPCSDRDVRDVREGDSRDHCLSIEGAGRTTTFEATALDTHPEVSGRSRPLPTVRHAYGGRVAHPPLGFPPCPPPDVLTRTDGSGRWPRRPSSPPAGRPTASWGRPPQLRGIRWTYLRLACWPRRRPALAAAAAAAAGSPPGRAVRAPPLWIPGSCELPAAWAGTGGWAERVGRVG